MLNQSVQHTIQALNSKFSAKIDEINNAVRLFASIQAQAAEFSLQKLQEVIGLTSVESHDDLPVDTSLRTFQQSFGLTSPVSQSLIPIRRLDVNGAVSGRYFEFPQLTAGQNDSLFCDPEFATKTIAKIEACIGVGIYSVRLTYLDGTQSPLFGHR